MAFTGVVQSAWSLSILVSLVLQTNTARCPECTLVSRDGDSQALRILGMISPDTNQNKPIHGDDKYVALKLSLIGLD